MSIFVYLDKMKLLPFVLLLLSPCSAFCQGQGNVWYFGDHAGLKFSTGEPVQISGGQTQFVGCPACHAEGSSVLCDSTGTLLLYTDGNQVWNAEHEVMPNGSGLSSNASATQSALILPLPGSHELFYVFTVDDFHLNGLQHGFRYSVVDMCLDNGNGDIIPSLKDLFLLDVVTEKLAAVRHANGTDYWVVVHKFLSDAFYAYPFTSLGIGTPVVSNVGSMHPIGSGGIGSSIGQMKISPTGDKLALVNGNSTPSILEYFDFNASTGEVSNAVPLVPDPLWMYYGVAFSPDGTKLYASVTLNGNGVYQFDLSAGDGDPTAVQASMVQIAGSYNFLGLQLAVNGKIYVSRSPFFGNAAIGAIHSPDAAGVACSYADSAIVLTNAFASYSFPSFVDSYDYSNGKPRCTTGIDDRASSGFRSVTNPVGDRLQLSGPDHEMITVSIFDRSGRCVQTFPPTRSHYDFDVSCLTPGLYFLTVQSKSFRSMVKFCKE